MSIPLSLTSQPAEHLHHEVRKTALWEDRSALHEQHDIVPADLALDALLYRSFIGFLLHSQKLAGSVIVVGLRAPRALAPAGLWGWRLSSNVDVFYVDRSARLGTFLPCVS